MNNRNVIPAVIVFVCAFAHRYGTLPDTVIGSAEGDGCVTAQCKHTLEADTGRIKR